MANLPVWPELARIAAAGVESEGVDWLEEEWEAAEPEEATEDGVALRTVVGLVAEEEGAGWGLDRVDLVEVKIWVFATAAELELVLACLVRGVTVTEDREVLTVFESCCWAGRILMIGTLTTGAGDLNPWRGWAAFVLGRSPE